MVENSENRQEAYDKLEQLKALSLVSQAGKVNELGEEDTSYLFTLI